MAIEYWSQEELEEYYEHPEIFINRAKEMRSKMIYELIFKLTRRIAKLLR